MNTHDGGPAFPMIWDATHEQNWKTEAGMSLRDYFAAAALQGALANPEYAGMPDDRIARGSWDIADAMLAARSAEK